MASINTNISAYYAQNNLRTAANQAQASIARLSSGNKIVSASDDVAALSIGTILRTTVSTLRTASTNASQGTTLLQVADGALGSLGEILQRQKALAVQANSGTLSDNERSYLNQEFQSLTSEYDRIVSKTNFNNVNLLDGSLAASKTAVATEIPAAGTNFVAKLTNTSNTINTAVLTGGLTALTVATVGTSDKAIAAVQGDLSGIKVSATYSTGSTGALSVQINGITFNSSVVAFDNTNTNTNVVLTQVLDQADTNAGKTAMVLNLDVADLNDAGTQIGMTASALKIQGELSKVSIYQDRAYENTAATSDTAITTSKFAGTVVQGLSGADIVFRGKDFDTSTGFAPSLSNFKITSNSATNATFSVSVNGVNYSSAFTTGNTGGVTVSATSDTLDLDGTGGSGTGVLRLTSANDANSYIDIDLATNTPGNISIVSQSDADGLAASLNKGFGSGSTGGLKFQVGTDSADTIGIAIKNIGSSAIFKDSTGATKNLDISTAAGAITASDVLDIAIKTVTSARADVGALQSRFGYASATLSTSIQNLDSARGQFLDTDVSAESTRFATEQVLQQAAISVLAQANQIPQNLLKLIG